jgi:hypothetical protein
VCHNFLQQLAEHNFGLALHIDKGVQNRSESSETALCDVIERLGLTCPERVKEILRECFAVLHICGFDPFIENLLVFYTFR